MGSGVQIPWRVVQGLMSDMMLGGSVRDLHDKQILDNYVQRFITPRLLDPSYEFAPRHALPKGQVPNYPCFTEMCSGPRRARVSGS